MARRSWYLPQADADRLASLVDDLHFTTRRPRHEVLAAVVGVIVDHRAEIEARLPAGRCRVTAADTAGPAPPERVSGLRYSPSRSKRAA